MRLAASAMAAVIVVVFMCNLTVAADFKKYDCEYFAVEIPTNCIVGGDTNTGWYSFDIVESQGTPQQGYAVTQTQLATVRFGLKGIELSLPMNYKYSDFNQTGFLLADNPALHFLNTFHIKKDALPK